MHRQTSPTSYGHSQGFTLEQEKGNGFKTVEFSNDFRRGEFQNHPYEHTFMHTCNAWKVIDLNCAYRSTVQKLSKYMQHRWVMFGTTFLCAPSNTCATSAPSFCSNVFRLFVHCSSSLLKTSFLYCIIHSALKDSIASALSLFCFHVWGNCYAHCLGCPFISFCYFYQLHLIILFFPDLTIFQTQAF